MCELVAFWKGEEWWREPLEEGENKKVGSLDKNDARVAPEFTSDWVVPDPALSGWHMTVSRQGDMLLVQRRIEPRPTSNKIFLGGTAIDQFELLPGEDFEIENSLVRFEWQVKEEAEAEVEPPYQTKTFRSDELRNLSYENDAIAADALDELTRLGQMKIGREKAAEEIAKILLAGLPGAAGAAVIHRSAEGTPRVLAQNFQKVFGLTGPFPFSPSLLEQALDKDFKPAVRDYLNPNKGERYTTVKAAVDWAICAPLAEAGEQLVLYVVGADLSDAKTPRSDRETRLKQAVKFVDLAASVLGVILKNSRLEEEKNRLRKFPPKALLPLLKLETAEYAQQIEPRRCQVTVLFCDLRGFSLFAEEHADDLLQSSRLVRRALNIIGMAIDAQEGVIGDLQGDAAMAFWGWPKDRPDQIERAAKAALAIVKAFHQEPDLRTNEFQCGVGLAHGDTVVGLMGIADLSKIDVFGPPVNRASRLESLTKRLGVDILVDERVREGLADLERQQKVGFRILPKVQLAGMRQACRVHELFSPHEESTVQRPDPNIWRAAMEAFHRGDWEQTRKMIERSYRDVPEDHWKLDRAVNWLLDWMNENTPPGDSSEVIVRLDKK